MQIKEGRRPMLLFRSIALATFAAIVAVPAAIVDQLNG